MNLKDVSVVCGGFIARHLVGAPSGPNEQAVNSGLLNEGDSAVCGVGGIMGFLVHWV